MPNPFAGMIKTALNRKPQDPLAEYGLEQGYGQKLKSALDLMTEGQYGEDITLAGEQAYAGGDFNPELSKYYSTKGVRETRTKGTLGAMQEARADEFRKAELINFLKQHALNERAMALQERAQKASEKTTWDDIFAGVSTLSGALPFLKKGGKVEKVMHEFKAGKLKSSSGQAVTDIKQALAIALSEARAAGEHAAPRKAEGGEVQPSEYYHSIYNSIIPPNEINAGPASTGDNVMIMAKDGERIIRPEADKMTGGATQMVNDAVELIKSLIY